MDLTVDFKSFQDLVQASLVNVTRTATQVSTQDLGFHRSSSDRVSRALDHQNSHLLRLTNKLLIAATQDVAIKPPSLQTPDGVEDNWRRIVDVLDDLLEKADSLLDEVSGVIKRASPPPPTAGTHKLAHELSWRGAANIPKPQLQFEKSVDNFDTTAFRPLLQTKPHALTPLEECLDIGSKHPYAHEIQSYTYPPAVTQVSPPLPFLPPDSSQAVYVDTEEGVRDMLEELKQASEIAIDLEHNDLRSFVGIVCLMQISTRDKDWIVDTLQPWRHKLQVLNQVFADPHILKVLHGSNMDIIWLQRDLGLYIVGLFDTYHAAVALSFPGKGLKHLLQQFANFHAQKQYQVADWRIRPLPAELLDYARSDTHYLLHIYDHVRNMLVDASTPDANLLDYVLNRSKDEALQVYERPIYDVENGLGPLGWYGLLTHRSITFSNEQFGVFRALHAWRDRKARELDEGVQYVLPNRVLWRTAEAMPTFSHQFHAIFRGTPKAVADKVPEIIEVIKQGRLDGNNGKPLAEVLKDHEAVYGVKPHRLPRAPREAKKARTTLVPVADALRQLAAARPVNPPPTTLTYDGVKEVERPIVDQVLISTFWGDVHLQSEEPTADDADATAAHALQSILPLHLVSSSIAVSGAPPVSAVPPTPEGASLGQLAAKVPDGARATASRPTDPESFTLKELSRAHKRKANDDDQDRLSVAVALNGDLGAPSAPVPDQYEAKRTAKKAKRAEKKARKATSTAAANAGFKPFDYAAADSLLDQAPAATGNANGPGAKQPNPFAKALDTSTGARRSKMAQEQTGKSMTFKS